MPVYGLIFTGFGLGAGLVAAIGAGTLHPGIVALLSWMTVGFVWCGAAYFLESARMFGKCRDGRISRPIMVLGLPVFSLNWLRWWISRKLATEPVTNEVVPELHVGGLPWPTDLPPGTRTIVDLTCEFVAHPEIRALPGYRVFPMLDDGFVDPLELEAIVVTLLDAPTPMLVHCGAGHSRSAALIAALGIARGDFSDPESAERAIQAVRPRVRFRSRQRELLTRWYLERRG